MGTPRMKELNRFVERWLQQERRDPAPLVRERAAERSRRILAGLALKTRMVELASGVVANFHEAIGHVQAAAAIQGPLVPECPAAWSRPFEEFTENKVATFPLDNPAVQVATPHAPYGLVFGDPAAGRIVFTVDHEGRVTIHPDVSLADVRALPLEYLRALREMVNTAIYDKERGK